jgi:hypothetical protein
MCVVWRQNKHRIDARLIQNAPIVLTAKQLIVGSQRLPVLRDRPRL